MSRGLRFDLGLRVTAARMLRRGFAALALYAMFWGAHAAGAETTETPARVLPAQSQITQDWRGRVTLDLALSKGVPWRVFTRSAPDRLVLDFQEVDFAPLDLLAFDRSDVATEVAAGPLRQGWSRMVIALERPMAVAEAALHISQTPEEVQAAASADEVSQGSVLLRLKLTKTSRASFDARAGAPSTAGSVGRWARGRTAPPPAVRSDLLTIVIDPGHGGLDPGAIRQGHEEADLVLALALALEDALTEAGVQVVLTRRSDLFVSLERRVAIAAQAEADAFVSLHADALAEGDARGATLYILSDQASDAASAALAERHNRVDLLAGVDLTATGDEVAQVLMDLARHDSAPRSRLLAQSLIAAISGNGLEMHRRPLQQAGFSVLKSADIPSVLVEAGFLSTDAELARLLDPVWRAQMAASLRDGLLAWAEADDALAPLRRQ